MDGDTTKNKVIGGKMIEIGRLCLKIAGRDAGKKCLIVDILDHKFVLIDGETRRRKCNVLHLEPMNQSIKIEKNASHEDVAKALKEIGIDVMQTKPKPKTQKPIGKRKTPEQLRKQKEEKKKLRDIFRPKKKEIAEGKIETSLEEKAGLMQEQKEEGTEAKTEAKSTRKETKKQITKKTEKKK